MLKNKRFKRIIIRKEGKEGVVVGEIFRDLLANPFLLQTMYDSGASDKEGIDGKEILRILTETEEGMNTHKLAMRLRRLNRNGWIKREKILKEEKKSIMEYPLRYRYLFGRKALLYLKKFKKFTNKDGWLMNPKQMRNNYGN